MMIICRLPSQVDAASLNPIESKKPAGTVWIGILPQLILQILQLGAAENILENLGDVVTWSAGQPEHTGTQQKQPSKSSPVHVNHHRHGLVQGHLGNDPFTGPKSTSLGIF